MHAQLPLHIQPKEVGCTHFRFLGVGSVLARCCVCFRLCNFVHIVSANAYGYKAQLKSHPYVNTYVCCTFCLCLQLQCTYAAYLYLHHLAHILLTLVKPLVKPLVKVKVAKVLTTYDVYVYSKLYTCASLPRSELMWLLQYEIANFYVLLI